MLKMPTNSNVMQSPNRAYLECIKKSMLSLCQDHHAIVRNHGSSQQLPEAQMVVIMFMNIVESSPTRTLHPTLWARVDAMASYIVFLFFGHVPH